MTEQVAAEMIDIFLIVLRSFGRGSKWVCKADALQLSDCR